LALICEGVTPVAKMQADRNININSNLYMRSVRAKTLETVFS